LGSSDLGDGRLVGANVFERRGASQAGSALADADALEREVEAWRREPPDADGHISLRLERLQEEVEALARERLDVERDRMVTEANATSIERALLLAGVLADSLNAEVASADEASVAERAREALGVLRDRQQVLHERSVAAAQAIAAFDVLDARLTAAAEALTRALAAAAVALASRRR
jgi:hypothetical protein